MRGLFDFLKQGLDIFGQRNDDEEYLAGLENASPNMDYGIGQRYSRFNESSFGQDNTVLPPTTGQIIGQNAGREYSRQQLSPLSLRGLSKGTIRPPMGAADAFMQDPKNTGTMRELMYGPMTREKQARLKAVNAGLSVRGGAQRTLPGSGRQRAPQLTGTFGQDGTYVNNAPGVNVLGSGKTSGPPSKKWDNKAQDFI